MTDNSGEDVRTFIVANVKLYLEIYDAAFGKELSLYCYDDLKSYKYVFLDI